MINLTISRKKKLTPKILSFNCNGKKLIARRKMKKRRKILLGFSHKGADDTISDLVDEELREHLQEQELGMTFSGSSRLPRPIWRLKFMSFVK